MTPQVTLARDTKRLTFVSGLSTAFVIVAVLAAAVSLGNMFPPSSLGDDLGEVR